MNPADRSTYVIMRYISGSHISYPVMVLLDHTRDEAQGEVNRYNRTHPYASHLLKISAVKQKNPRISGD